MDTSKMLRPEELPFEVPEQLKEDIYELIDALENKRDYIGPICADIHGGSRALSKENSEWIINYYAEFGWLND